MHRYNGIYNRQEKNYSLRLSQSFRFFLEIERNKKPKRHYTKKKKKQGDPNIKENEEKRILQEIENLKNGKNLDGTYEMSLSKIGIKKFENQMAAKEQTIVSLSQKLNEKEMYLLQLKNTNGDYKNQIENLQQEKTELISKIPNSSDLENKNLTLKEYRDAKFLPAKYDEDLIIHI